MNITIKRLTPELNKDYLDFFDNRAFTDDNPNGPCYCTSPNQDEETIKKMVEEFKAYGVKETLRKYAAEMLDKNLIHGYLAYDGELAIGWCNAADIDSYTGFVPDFARKNTCGKTMSIVCFEIAPQYRGMGIASAFIEQICSDAKANGYMAVEGYSRIFDVRNDYDYQGPMELYRKAGFAEVMRENGQVVMRRMLSSMNARIVGLFSGFPEHHFNNAIERVLRENLPKRDSIVFISADPENYAQNDDDRDGMHEMFAERGMAFSQKYVIDKRTDAKKAVKLVREADCIWLMGGESKWQIELIRDLGLELELRESREMILGVSAGSMNLGHFVAYIWDDPEFYEGLGLTNTTIKSHYEEGEWFLPTLLKMSMIHPIVAMKDMSAIFIKCGDIWKIGDMFLIDKGEISPLTDEMLRNLRAF